MSERDAGDGNSLQPEGEQTRQENDQKSPLSEPELAPIESREFR